MEINTPPKICLNMIVKNESSIITRLFDSVISIIDTYCICDTGSTDNTIEVIEKYFNEKGIVGKIITEPFKNFSYNRNVALKSCLGMSDFVLLLDADMVLQVNNFDKNILSKADSFNILQGNDSFYYENMRIIRNNALYKYNGVTHEYIDTPTNNKTFPIEKNVLFILDIGDGGSKENKFYRDIELLLDGINDEPHNPRYHFYLANSYYDLERYNEAITMYLKRIKIGGWREEVFYSYYRIGLCYKKLDKMSDAIFYWLEGYDYYPERLETIYEIIHYYRLTSNHKLCEGFYNIVKENLDKNINRDHYLFLHNDIYSYKLHFEYTIFAAYIGKDKINDEIMTVLNNSHDNNEISCLLSNMKFYKDIIKPENKYILDDQVILNLNNQDMKFTSSSSCLIKVNDSYKLNVRYVNYHINENGSYKNCDNHIITINKFVELDSNFNIINETWFNLTFDNRLYIGIEDVKIFNDIYDSSNKLLYIGTGYHTNNKIGIVSGEYDIVNKKFHINELNQTFIHTSCEKNWVYVDYNNDNHIIYNWFPLQIGKVQNNILNIIERKSMPQIFSLARGSTCGFNYNKKIGENNNTGNIKINIEETEIWFINHIVSYEEPRHYYHIISVFDHNLDLLRYSAPFKFEDEPIEFCLSIIVEDDRVLINYSNWDRTTRIGVYDKKYIENLLKYKN